MSRRKIWILYLTVFLIPIISMLIIMFMQDAYPFGDKTILYGDINQQLRYFVRNFCDIVESHHSLFWSWNGGMGYDFFSNFLYYLACPVTWIVLLFGKTHVEAGLVCVFLIYAGLSGVTFLYFIRHSVINKMEKSIYTDLFGVVFALAYAMCDYMLAYRFNIMWMPCLVLAPLVMLGVEKLVHEKKYGLYFATLLMCFLFNFYFSWYVCILSVVWFIEQEKMGIKDFFVKGARFAGISILSAMSAAVVLIPAYAASLNQNRDRYTYFEQLGTDSHASFGNFLQGFIWGHNLDRMGHYQFCQNNYCGIFVFVFAILWLIMMKKNIQNIKRFITLAVFSAGSTVLYVGYILQGFTLPYGYNNRFVFILIILLIVSAYQCMNGVVDIKLFHIVILDILMMAVLLIAMIDSTNMYAEILYVVSFLLIACFSIIIILYKKDSIKKNTLYISIVIVGFAELIGDFFVTNLYAINNWDDDISYNDWKEEYNNLEAPAGERKTTWINNSITLNASDTDLFASVTNKGMYNLLAKLGCNDFGTSFYSVSGSNKLLLTLFNVRYVLTDNPYEFGGLCQTGTIGEYAILENTETAGLGFVTDKDILGWDIDCNNPFKVQNEYVNRAFNEDDLFAEISMEKAEVYTYNCTITGYENGEYTYVTAGSGDDICEIDYNVILPECDDLYVYINTNGSNAYGIYLNGNLIYSFTDVFVNDMVYIGRVSEGDELTISLFNPMDNVLERTVSVYLGDMRENIYQNCLSDMRESDFKLLEFEDTYVKASVCADDSGILFTSIPYYRGFRAYVDGKETDIAVLHDSFICLETDEGSHIVEIKYFPYGLKTGIIISCLGVIAFAFVEIKNRKKMKKA